MSGSDCWTYQEAAIDLQRIGDHDYNIYESSEGYNRLIDLKYTYVAPENPQPDYNEAYIWTADGDIEAESQMIEREIISILTNR